LADELAHPEWGPTSPWPMSGRTNAATSCPARALDGYMEQPVRVSSTALITSSATATACRANGSRRGESARLSRELAVVVGPRPRSPCHRRSFERDQTFYDWQHYIALVQRKPGALRNGAPIQVHARSLQQAAAVLLRQPHGDRVMAQVLAAVTLHGLEAVLVAVELALQSGLVRAEHVLNVLGRKSIRLARSRRSPRRVDAANAAGGQHRPLRRPAQADHVVA
jgi:hypothetical protein